jgi:large subunit ribosomal protein L21
MYAVMKTGGKQYRVEAGSMLTVEKVRGELGSSITFDRILLVGDGDAVTVGSPTVPNASVSGTIIGEALGPKIVVFKFKQKVKYRRRTGHRQHLTRVRIDSITADGKTVKAEAPEPRAKRKPAAEKKPVRQRATKSEAPTSVRGRTAVAAGEAETAKPKTARTTSAKPKAVAPKSAKPRTAKADTSGADVAPPARRTRGRAAQTAESATTEQKPRARRTTKPKTESAPEE